MTSRWIAVPLAAAALGIASCPAVAQPADAPPAERGAGLKKAHAKAKAKPSAKAEPAAAAGPARRSGGETEASSLERRRRAFFATKPDEATPDPETPPAGVTLGGSGGLSPGMGFKF